LLRLHAQMNFTCFIYLKSLSFDVKRKICIPMMYIVYILYL